MAKIVLREDFIKLGQALKAAKLVGSGVEAKIVILDGKVKVNGQVELQRGKKLYDKDVVSFAGETIEIVKETPFPFTVFIMIAVGIPLVAFASSKAALN